MSNFDYTNDAYLLNSLLSVKGAAVHFIGALGCGMLPLARLLVSRGCRVSGSDSRAADISLRDIPFSVAPHSADNVRGKALVVYSLAVGGDNVELAEAARLGIPTVTRAQLLGALMLSYGVRVGVSGSHGKSTSVAILDSILNECASDFTTVSGATLADGRDSRIGGGELILYEACEYKDSFLHFSPTYQIITGIELDHTDYFGSLDEVYSSFLRCARLAERGVIVNGDCPTASRLVNEEGVNAYTYGRGEGCFFRLCDVERRGVGYSASVVSSSFGRVDFYTELMGVYNLYNITAAISAAMLLGVDCDSISRAVGEFRGIERRQSRIGELRQRPVLYDYAHHPSEIAATIDALNERYGACTVVFRPHTYSRTKSLWNEFIQALCKARFTILLDIYPAREKSIPGVTSQALAKAMGGGAVCLNEDEVLEFVLSHTLGAIVIMGAGDVDRLLDILRSSNEFNK